MPRFRYVGPFDEIEIPTLGVVVARGAEFDAPEGHGIDGQDTFELVTPTPPTPHTPTPEA